MNRNKFIQNLPRFNCDSCGKALWKMHNFYSITKDKKICVSCYQNPRHNVVYEKMEPFSAWRRREKSPMVFPNLLFFDGRHMLDMESKEFVGMKPADVRIYYFRIRDEKDYEIETIGEI